MMIFLSQTYRYLYPKSSRSGCCPGSSESCQDGRSRPRHVAVVDCTTCAGSATGTGTKPKTGAAHRVAVAVVDCTNFEQRLCFQCQHERSPGHDGTFVVPRIGTTGWSHELDARLEDLIYDTIRGCAILRSLRLLVHYVSYIAVGGRVRWLGWTTRY
jgi:hypothetical protein